VTKRQSLKVRQLCGGACPALPQVRSRACAAAVRACPPCAAQLLGELLLDRTNFNVMTIYISNPDNLKLMMNLLRDSSRNVQFEAFHVFKVRE